MENRTEKINNFIEAMMKAQEKKDLERRNEIWNAKDYYDYSKKEWH